MTTANVISRSLIAFAALVVPLHAASALDLGRSVLHPNDGWAAFGSGVAWNAVNDPDLGFDAGWVPTLNHQLLPGWTTPLVVPLLAGPIF